MNNATHLLTGGPALASPTPRGKRRWPLEADFAVVAMVVIAAGAIAGTLVHVRSDSDTRRAAEADASFAAAKGAQLLQASSDSIDAITKPIAGNPDYAQVFTLGTCSVGYGPLGIFGTGHVDIVRSDGTVICSSLKPKNTASYQGAAWLQSPTPLVVAPSVDPATGNQVAIYAYPIAGKGDLVWFFDLKGIGEQLASQLGSGVHQLEFLVVSSDGKQVIARSIAPDKWTGAKLATTSFANTAADTDRIDVGGIERWYGSARVKGTGWIVYAGADKAAALAGARGLQVEELEVVGAGILAVILALFVVYRRVATPIAALSSAVRSSRGLDTPSPVRVSGPAQVASLGEDINALMTSLRHEWEERTSVQHNYLQLFEGSPLPIMFVDTTNGKFLEVNQAAIATYGYSHEEFANLTEFDIHVPLDEKETRGVEALRWQNPDSSFTRYGPVTATKKDGTLRHVMVTSYAVRYGGKPARVSMVEDVTERENLERQRNQSQRLESLGQLAGGVAHDFNNLLGVILNFALFAKEKVLAVADSSSEVSDNTARPLRSAASDMDRVVRAGESASRLTHQLLAFARREVLRPQALDVNTVVRELEPLLRRTIGEHIEFVTILSPDAQRALMDPGQLEQVLINLAINARDAMPKGGRLVIDTENVDVDDAYAAGRPDLKPGRYVRLRVSDTGTGMDDGTLQHVFEPFFTTKPKGHGTGLGLATVYGIIQQSGGYIAVYSELGGGTRVSALLPATEQAIVEVAAAPKSNGAGHSGTVLVVEDADDLREVTERILTRNGFHVITAGDGPSAIEAARQHEGKIDLLLTDVVMPRMHGTELAEMIVSTRPGIHILFMSGYAEPMLGASGRLEPGVLLLEKPFTESTLLVKVGEALGKAR